MNLKTKDDEIILSGTFIYTDKKELLLLFRKDHQHYETPGGKVEDRDCKDKENPSIHDFKQAAKRELVEELGSEFKHASLDYFGFVSFTVPDGRKAVAHKFITKSISGTPQIQEPQTFSTWNYLAISSLEKESISPDLKLFLPELKKRFLE